MNAHQNNSLMSGYVIKFYDKSKAVSRGPSLAVDGLNLRIIAYHNQEHYSAHFNGQSILSPWPVGDDQSWFISLT